MVKRATKGMKKMTPNTSDAIMSEKTIEVTRRVFNLDTLQKEVIKGEVKFTPVTDLASALARVGGDQNKLVEALNKSFEREAWSEGRKNLSSDNPNVIANVKVLMDVLRPLRTIIHPIPEKPTPEQRAAQNATLFAWLKQEANKQILEGIKAKALESEEEETEGTESETDTEK